MYRRLRRTWRRWLANTHGNLFELHRHYAAQLFHSELITSPDDLRRVVITSLAGVASLGFIVPKLYYKKYEHLAFDAPFDLFRRAVYADILFFLVFTMLAVAVVVAFQWDALFPDRRDQNVLRPLPLKLWQIYAAKLTTLTAFVLLLVLLLTIPCAFSFAAVINGPNFLAPSWREMFAHVATTLLAGLFTLYALTSIQSIFVLILPQRIAGYLSSSLQSFLLAGALVLIPWIMGIPNLIESIDDRPTWAQFAPPAWFFALYLRLLGRAGQTEIALSSRSLLAMIIVIGLTVVLNVMLYRRHAARLELESDRNSTSFYDRVVEALGWRIGENARTAGLLAFVMKSMRRSHRHRMVRLVYAGVGCALVLESAIGVFLSGGWLAHGRTHGAALDALFALPVALFFFLFSGLRYIFRLPIEVRANWIFRLAAPDAFKEREKAVRMIYLCCAVVPAIATTAPFLFILLPWWRTLFAIVFALLLGELLIEYDIEQNTAIPFTCGYLPGKRNILHTGIVYWFTFFVLTSVIAAFEEVFSRTPLRASLTLLMMMAVLYRSQKQRTETKEMIFEEIAEPAVATLGLARE
ncbi:MAG TPA: hypothetical protein VF493_02125 [Terriglobales bacterium]